MLPLATSGAASQESPPSPSVLEIPFSLSLQGLFRETERIVPTRVGNWRQWRPRHGVDTRYLAWRGPLAFRLFGDTLTLQAHVRYRVQVRKELLGALEVEADCGVDEAPRQAVIGLQVRLAWNPDWTPRPLFRLLPTRFLDRCEMTAAGIDVTPLVGREFQEQMRRSLRRTLTELVPAMGTVRERAAEIWQRMNRPLAFTEGSWLQLRPTAVALSPLYGIADEARVHLAVALWPQLSLGERPASRPVPLLPLRPLFPGSPGLRFEMTMEVDYGQIGRSISAGLAGKNFQVKEFSFGIETVELSGAGQELHARLHLDGQARGRAEIWVEPGFDPESQSLRLEGLDYVFEPEDDDLYLLAGLFYEKIRQALIETANRLLEQEMVGVRERLETALTAVMPQGAHLDLGQLSSTGMKIEFLPQGVRLQGAAAGSIQIGL